jgi:TrpR-related protein YerC/YecD
MDEDKIRNAETDALMHAILSIQTEEEAYCFFEDLCTVAEIQSMAQRLEVACLLRQKKTYNEIAQMTGASTATISRVNRALVWGRDGYKNILDRISEPTMKDEV